MPKILNILVVIEDESGEEHTLDLLENFPNILFFANKELRDGFSISKAIRNSISCDSSPTETNISLTEKSYYGEESPFVSQTSKPTGSKFLIRKKKRLKKLVLEEAGIKSPSEEVLRVFNFWNSLSTTQKHKFGTRLCKKIFPAIEKSLRKFSVREIEVSMSRFNDMRESNLYKIPSVDNFTLLEFLEGSKFRKAGGDPWLYRLVKNGSHLNFLKRPPKNPKLAEFIQKTYCYLFLGSNNPNVTARMETNFFLAADRLHDFMNLEGKRKVRVCSAFHVEPDSFEMQKIYVGFLMEAVKDSWKGKMMSHNLSSEHSFSELLPSHIERRLKGAS